MGRWMTSPLGLQREEAGSGQLVKRFVPAPPEIGDDARDQGIVVDFPRSDGAS